MTFDQIVYDVGFIVISAIALVLLFSPYAYYLMKKDEKQKIYDAKFAKMVDEKDPIIKNKLRKELGLNYTEEG